MLAKDIKPLMEAYADIYNSTTELVEEDILTDELIEEIVEELVEEYIESGYDLDESLEAIEEATTEYLMELNPYAPAGSKEASAYNKTTTATKRGEARKAAVKAAVGKVRAKAAGAAVSAYAAGKSAKEGLKSAARATKSGAQKAAGAVSSAAQSAKAGAEAGVKKLLGKGLRAVSGGAGKAAQVARKVGSSAGKAASRLGEETDVFDYILEYLVSEGYADTNQNALVIMANMSEEWREEIIDESRRADKLGHERGTAANPSRKDVPHGDPSQRTMLHSRLKSRANEMGRARRNSPRYKAGERPSLSKKEKGFLQASDRTAHHVRNPNVPDSGSHAEWPSQRKAQKDPKQNPKHNANKG